MNKTQKRIVYGVLFTVLLLIEVAIALWVTDDFVRPYVGDMLVTLLLCCLVRIIFLEKPRGLAVYVFFFATVVEIAQYFDYVALLGLADNSFLSVLMGRSFAFADIVCYAVGCIAFWVLEMYIQRRDAV